MWKGIDSTITRFCEEAGFARAQLFAVRGPLPKVIEDTREDLAADVQADSDLEEYIYRTLREPWPSQAAPIQQIDRQTPAVSDPPSDQAGGVAEPKTAKQFLNGTEGGVISTKPSQPAA